MSASASCNALKPGSLSSRIMDVLRQHGPLKRIDIADELNTPLDSWALSSALSALRSRRTKRGGKKPRMIYVKRWDHDDDDGSVRIYPRPVYAIGSRSDATRPKSMTATERSRNFRLRKAAQKAPPPVQCASVFEWSKMVHYAPQPAGSGEPATA